MIYVSALLYVARSCAINSRLCCSGTSDSEAFEQNGLRLLALGYVTEVPIEAAKVTCPISTTYCAQSKHILQNMGNWNFVMVHSLIVSKHALRDSITEGWDVTSGYRGILYEGLAEYIPVIYEGTLSTCGLAADSSYGGEQAACVAPTCASIQVCEESHEAFDVSTCTEGLRLGD